MIVPVPKIHCLNIGEDFRFRFKVNNKKFFRFCVFRPLTLGADTRTLNFIMKYPVIINSKLGGDARLIDVNRKEISTRIDTITSLRSPAAIFTGQISVESRSRQIDAWK